MFHTEHVFHSKTIPEDSQLAGCVKAKKAREIESPHTHKQCLSSDLAANPFLLGRHEHRVGDDRCLGLLYSNCPRIVAGLIAFVHRMGNVQHSSPN